MIKRILTFILTGFCSLVAHGQERAIIPGMKISQTVKIKKSIYRIDAADSLNRPVIMIEGDNITVDFNNAELAGSTNRKNPDEFFGVAVIIRNSRNLIIKNLKIRGYKVALLAKNVENLTLDSCDFSYNYRQHLNSTQDKEDISDWMSYHHNEKDEWLRYGAAIYLRGCNSVVVANCKVTGGQNALMMTECDNGMIYGNDFSFNSGIGLGLYRCSNNRVMNNRIIFNVRGYSHNVYKRGQDSAGILVYEQSNKNWFFKNQVTHSGDGFFLWAGQTTMDTGEGGCNDNILYGNDFSFAPTNGIEVTFSRNHIISNIINECDHGIWGGYSYGTQIDRNTFRNNRIAIAIEHGQDNAIFMNEFEGNEEAIRLWARKAQPAGWGYAKKRDTRSRNYAIHSNLLLNNKTAFNLSLSDSLQVIDNYIKGSGITLKKDTAVTHFDFINNDSSAVIFLEGDRVIWPDSIVKAGRPLKIPDEEFAGRKNILITEWGPYDFRSPIIWNTNPADTGDVMYFNLLGPAGKWVIKNFRGVRNISAGEGILPATISAEEIKGERTDIIIELEYSGSSVTTPFGEKIPAGTPYRFFFRKFFQPINWEIDWFSFDSLSNPVHHPEYLYQLNKRPPIGHEIATKLSYAWWGGIKNKGLTYSLFFTLARGHADIPGGLYELSVTWDDAVRVYVDEKLVIDEWNPSNYTFDESPNKKIKLQLGGHHNFRVEHVELGGFATLSLKLKKL